MRLLPLLLLAACSLDLPWSEPGLRYEVERGDTLYLIAVEHEVTVDDLRRWNDLQGDLIEVGQELVIRPGDATGTEAPLGGPGGARSAGSGSAGRAGLTRPPPKPCIDLPTEVEGEHGIAAGRGLTAAQVDEPLDAVVGHALDCLPDGWARDATVMVSLTVGCDGRVADARVLDQGGLPEAATACVADTLSHAGFPAHDLPDGFTFRYPVEFRF